MSMYSIHVFLSPVGRSVIEYSRFLGINGAACVK